MLTDDFYTTGRRRRTLLKTNIYNPINTNYTKVKYSIIEITAMIVRTDFSIVRSGFSEDFTCIRTCPTEDIACGAVDYLSSTL